MEFEAFKKIPRIEKLNNRVVITEKLDGTNAQVAFNDAGEMFVGSRNRWLTPECKGPKGCDNFGFAAWCRDNRSELEKLGPGRHFGEWYGRGIGPRGYGLEDRRFALFNTRRWGNPGQTLPACVQVVPVLWEGNTDSVHEKVLGCMDYLRTCGSEMVRGYMDPEGVVAYLCGSDAVFKGIIEKRGPSAIEAA